MTDLNLTGRTIGRFDILDELGRGGMAVVYKARQKSPNRIVAFKVLPPELTYNKDYIARFHQEADSVAALEHPHIVPIYAVDEDQGMHYIAMKYIQGRTLKEVAQQEGAFSVERAIQLVGQVAEALDYAHSQQVIHRDIKPSNMMVDTSGWVYLTDFGLARGAGLTAGLTATGTVMGTPEYMSPEQAQGLSTIGPATDIYALGVVLYELLTGRFPFEADTPMGMLAARLLQPPRPPREYRNELPLGVEDVIMRALARRPEARYKTAGEMIADLRRATGVGQVPQPQRPATPSDGLTIAVGPTPTPASQQMAYRPSPTPQPQPQPTPQSQPLPNIVPPPPVWTPPPVPPAPSSGKRGFGIGLLIGIGTTILLLVLACVGLIAWGSTLSTNATPTPTTQARVNTAPVAQATEGTEPTELTEPTDAAPTVVPTVDPAVAKQIKAGDTALEQADFNAAELAYQQAAQKETASAAGLTRLALLNDFEARYNDVVDQSTQAIDAAQNDPQQAALAHALLADALMVGSKFQDAVDAATEASELDGTLGLASAVRANALARLASERREPDHAAEVLPLIETARKELKDDPKVLQALTYSLIGDTYISLYDLSSKDSDLSAAKDAYNTALGLSDQPLFHAGLGFANNRSKDYAGARGSFNAALEKDTTFVQAQLGLGWADFYDPEIKNYDPALEKFNKALESAPDNPWALYARGRALFSLSKYPEASDAFLKATAVQSDSLILSWLGRARQREGFKATDREAEKQFYIESAQAFQDALDLNDRETLAWTYLGWTRQYQEQYDESIEAFNKALEIDGTADEAHNGLGWSFFNLSKYPEAEQSFRRAIELDSTYTNAFYGLGQTLEKLGKIDDAKQAYRDALKIQADYKEAQDALDKLPK